MLPAAGGGWESNCAVPGKGKLGRLAENSHKEPCRCADKLDFVQKVGVFEDL